MGASLHKNQEDTTIQSKKLSRIPRKQGSLSWGFIGKEKRMTISWKSGQSAGRVDNQPGRVEECAGCMGWCRAVFTWNDPLTSWDTALYESALSTESVSEPVEPERFRLKPPDASTFALRAIRSSLKIFAKTLIIKSTTGLGVQGGKAQAEMTLWEPRTINCSSLASSPTVSRSRKAMHTGQQRFDTPIVRPKVYFHNKKRWGSGGETNQRT